MWKKLKLIWMVAITICVALLIWNQYQLVRVMEQTYGVESEE